MIDGRTPTTPEPFDLAADHEDRPDPTADGSGTSRALRSAIWRFRVPIVGESVLAVLEFAASRFGWAHAGELLGVGMVAILVIWLILGLARASRSARLPRLGLRTAMLLVLASALVFAMARTFGTALGWLAGLSIPPIALVWVVARLRRQGPQRDALLRVEAIAAQANLPLGPAARAFASLCDSAYGSRVEGLAKRLEQGRSLPDASDADPGVLPAEAVAIARATWGTDRLGPGLELAARAQSDRDRDLPTAFSTFAYPCAMIVIVAIGLTLIFGPIRTKILWILFEFETESDLEFSNDPNAVDELGSMFIDWSMTFDEAVFTGFLRVALTLGQVRDAILEGLARVGIAGGFVDFAITNFLFPILVLVLLAVLPIVAYVAIRRAWSQTSRGVEWLAVRGQRNRRLPIGESKLGPRVAAIALRAFAEGLEAGRTLPELLALLVQGPELGGRARRRAARARQRIRSGSEWSEALRRTGFVGRGDAEVLAAAGRASNLPWALRNRADSIDRRRTYRLRAASTVLRTLAIAGAGLLVLSAALTIFLPLVRVLQQMSETT